MSVLSWLEGKTGPEYETARWVHDQLEERVRAGDVVGLAEHCVALQPIKGVFCGIMLGGYLGRDEVVRDGLEELRILIRTMPDEVCEKVFAIVERGGLPIHLASRREQYEASRANQLATTVETIRAQLANSEPRLLVQATAALLLRKDEIVGGLTLPRTLIERTELAQLGLARLEEVLATLPDDECLAIIEMIRARFTYHLARSLCTAANLRAGQIAVRRHLAALASDAESEPRNPELEAVLDDDVTGYAVLGDFLQRHGHPRGELIALQLRAETDPAWEAPAQMYLETHAVALLGSLAAYRQTRGPRPRSTFTWRRGFIDRLDIAHARDSDDEPTSAQLLQRALAHPAGRLVRAIEVELDGRFDVAGDVLEAIAPHRRIRDVALVARYDQPFSGDVESLWSLPDLRSVRIEGGSIDLGTIDHPWLERAVFVHGLTSINVRAIASARWPRLQYLDLDLGNSEVGLADVRLVLARTDLPQLVHLGLATRFSDELCGALITSPLAGQLRELDLSFGSLTDAGAQTLVRGARSLPKLERLAVSENHLSIDGIRVLQAAFSTVVVGEQREPDDDDY